MATMMKSKRQEKDKNRKEINLKNTRKETPKIKQEVETNLKEHKLKKRGKIRKMKCWSSLFAGFLMEKRPRHLLMSKHEANQPPTAVSTGSDACFVSALFGINVEKELKCFCHFSVLLYKYFNMIFSQFQACKYFMKSL